MSSCPQRYASKSIRTLNYLRTPPATPEPLLFLYPRWFRLDSTHRYHTEHAPGRDNQSRHGKRGGNTDAAVSVTVSKPSARRHYSSSKRHSEQPEKPPIPSSRSSDTVACNDKTTASESPRTILQKSLVRRCMVPSPVWTPMHIYAPRQEVLERRAHYIRQLNPNVLLSILKSIPLSPQGSSQDVPRVPLSNTALNELIPNDIGEITWRHNDGSGCLIKLHQGHAELSGTERARELARDYLSETGSYTRSQTHLDWYADALHGSYLPVEDIPHPPTWTVRSLIDYVEIITRTRIRRSAHRTMYDDSDSHHRAVFRILKNIFSDSATTPLVSTVALRLALSYCRRHTEIPSTAAQIWKAFLRTGLHPDIACFNEELGRCLVGKEFTRLCKTVLEMEHIGIQPDSTTWAIVTMYTQSESSRAEISQLAKMTTLSESRVSESLVIATTKRDIQAYLGSDNGVQRFMEQMQDRFGPDWLTSRVLERMLRACRVRNPKLLRVSEILLALKEAGKYDLINRRCVVELIHISRKAGNLRDALGLAKHEALSPIADLPQVVIDLLFSMAWEEKYFNLCRYFWFLGATAGRVTFRMQYLVTKSLKSNVSQVEDTTEASWRLLAGKIIIGTNLDTEGFDELFPHLSKSKTQSTPVGWLLDWIPDGDARVEQLHLGQLLVERDLNAFRFYERLSRKQFVTLMDKALALDEKWKATNAATTVSPQELVDRSLKIFLKEREAILEHQGGARDEKLRRRWFIVNNRKVDFNTLKYDATQQIETEDTHDAQEAQEASQIAEQHLQEGNTVRDLDRSTSGDGTDSPRVCKDNVETDVEEQPAVVWQGFG